jgi:RHS repeat-associated protein
VEKATSAGKLDYLYDLSGNAVAEWTTSSGYTGWSTEYVYFNGGLVAEYKNNTTYFVHADLLGSARLVTGVGQTQVSNGGFESGLTGWSVTNATVITDATRAHSGTNYAQLSAPANGSATVLGQNLAVQPGDQINFGGWAYLESGGGSAVGWLLQAENSSQSGIAWIGAGPMPTTSSGWTFQSGTYTVPQGVAYVELYAQIWQATAASVLRVDDGFLYNNRTSMTIAQNLDYLPYGELNSTDSGITTHEFTGDEQDAETALAHTWFRQYSSSMGRWMTSDPAGLAAVDPTNPQSWNRYAYVLNNPPNLIDPWGLCSPGTICVTVWGDGGNGNGGNGNPWPTTGPMFGGAAPGDINAEAQIFARTHSGGRSGQPNCPTPLLPGCQALPPPNPTGTCVYLNGAGTAPDPTGGIDPNSTQSECSATNGPGGFFVSGVTLSTESQITVNPDVNRATINLSPDQCNQMNQALNRMSGLTMVYGWVAHGFWGGATAGGSQYAANSYVNLKLCGQKF